MKQSGPQLPLGYAIFCDDVRQEVGGKTSMMGIYSGELRFSTPAPVVMPMLCVNIVWVCHSEEVPERLVFVVYKDSPGSRETMLEANVEVSQDQMPDIYMSDEHDPESPPIVNMNFEARFGAIQFDGDCVLRVRLRLDGEEQRIGALRVRFPESDEIGAAAFDQAAGARSQ